MRTDRLRLRKYRREDREDLFALLTDERVMRRVGLAGDDLPETAGNVWRAVIDGGENAWAVVAGPEERYVGHCFIKPREEAPGEWEIGYLLGKAEWGRGFATEIAGKLIEYGFEELALDRVWATVDDDHGASIRVLEKIGMEFVRHEYDEQGRFSVYAVRRK